MSQAINYLAFNLYQKQTKEETNLFFSPLSLSTAISILLCGSAGDAASEMKSVLGYDLVGFSDDKICSSFKLLHSALEKIPKSFSLTSANVLLSQKNFAIKEEFKNLVDESFQAKVMEADFTQESTKAVEQVNDWVSDKTNGMITQLLDSIDPATVMIILNAVYFKGQWMQQFDEKDTSKQLFFNKGGPRENGIEIDMMYLKRKFRFVEEESFKALDLPYAGEEISMLVLLPNENDGLPELEKKIDSDFIKDLNHKLVLKEVEVSLPKFKLEYQNSMKPYFKALGLQSIFNPGADFSGISDSKELLISDVVHKAVLEVNEQGTVAAAATAAVMMFCAMPMNPTFVADHPFMFLIYNTKTELILFMGRLVEMP